MSASSKAKKMRRDAKAAQKLRKDKKKLKKANKQLVCDLKAEKKKTKKAKNKAAPLARKFTKWGEKAPAVTAILVMVLLLIAGASWLYRSRGPAITFLLLLAVVLAFFGTWAIQALATKKNHR